MTITERINAAHEALESDEIDETDADETDGKIYKLVGTYQGQSEDVENDIEGSQEAMRLLGEYQMAFGSDWSIVIEEE